MSYADCAARISQLDTLLRGLDPSWVGNGSLLGSSMLGNTALALNSQSPFAGVLESISGQTTSGTTSSNALGFSSPLAKYQITQDFGPTSETLEPAATVDGVTYAHYHNGIDLAAPLGTPVLAAASGTVTFAGAQSDGAVVVKIKHDDGYSTLYGHLDPSLSVVVGQHVEAGAPGRREQLWRFILGTAAQGDGQRQQTQHRHRAAKTSRPEKAGTGSWARHKPHPAILSPV